MEAGMAVIICKRHGEQMCTEISPKAFSFIREFAFSPDFIVPLYIVEGDLRNYNFSNLRKEYSPHWVHREEIGQPPLEGQLSEEGDAMFFKAGSDEYIDAWFFVHDNPVCRRCFQEYREGKLEKY